MISFQVKQIFYDIEKLFDSDDSCEVSLIQLKKSLIDLIKWVFLISHVQVRKMSNR